MNKTIINSNFFTDQVIILAYIILVDMDALAGYGNSSSDEEPPPGSPVKFKPSSSVMVCAAPSVLMPVSVIHSSYCVK